VPNNRRSTGRAEVKPFAAELTRLTPRGTAQPIVFEKRHKLPAVVQGTYGLGRITVVGFDTDEGRFATWDNRRDFWYALLDLREPNPGQNVRQMNPWETPTDLASRLAEQLESFGDVQVISFGWVALFILVYIIIVGPLDYLFLKKVVKRLEWTWVTFPAVVLVVSLGAYFLAHYLKGDELRINKLDLVEVDAQRGQVYGTSWFTVFSPRLQHYQVGITPSGVTAAPDTVNVSWMGRPGYNSRSLGRGQGPGLFTRSYDYDKNGELLKGVPIQVWSMKSLTARWSVKADPTPPLAATLTEGTGLSPIRGNLTSNLNQPLIQCKLLYRGDVWNVGRLEKGQPVVVRSEQKLTTQEGLQGSWGYTGVMARNPRQSRYDYNFGTQRGPENLHDLVKQLMFYRRLPHDQRQQSEYLDFADQTWRLDTFPSEAILIGIVEDANGASAAINDAGRLGCKLAPFEPELRGTLTQSTVVRAYFPVAPRAGDEAAPDK
jgi:hypothetical protein